MCIQTKPIKTLISIKAFPNKYKTFNLIKTYIVNLKWERLLKMFVRKKPRRWLDEWIFEKKVIATYQHVNTKWIPHRIGQELLIYEIVFYITYSVIKPNIYQTVYNTCYCYMWRSRFTVYVDWQIEHMNQIIIIFMHYLSTLKCKNCSLVKI